MKKFVLRAACAALLTVGLAAGQAGAHAQVGPDSVATVSKARTITIESYAFTTPKKVAAGAKVKVVNLDGVTHTVTAVDGTFQAVVAGGASGQFKAPSLPGRYKFYCAIHRSMRGVLVVK